MSISWFFCLSFLVYGYHLMGDGVTAWLFKRNDIMTESCLANITTSVLLLPHLPRNLTAPPLRTLLNMRVHSGMIY